MTGNKFEFENQPLQTKMRVRLHTMTFTRPRKKC